MNVIINKSSVDNVDWSLINDVRKESVVLNGHITFLFTILKNLIFILNIT